MDAPLFGYRIHVGCCIVFRYWAKIRGKGWGKMKQDEKKPITWEVADPKPPVIQSGRMENKKAN